MIGARRMGMTAGAVLVATILLAGLVDRLGGDDGIEFATSLALWIALSESWIVLSGFTGYISLGHAAFVGAGAYTTVLLWGVVPFWLGLCLGAAVGGVLAAAIGTPCLRVRGPYFVILTFGVAEFLRYLVIAIEARLGKFGRLLLDAPDQDTLLFVAAGLAGCAFLIAYAVRHSRLGIGLRAIRENETCAEMTGVRVGVLKIGAFALSAVIPAAVGGVMISRTGYFEPAQIFSPRISLTIITICIAGGSDSPWGPVLGAVFLQLMSEWLSESAPQLYLIILGSVLVLFVLCMPDGLAGQWGGLKRRLRPAAA